MMDEPIRLRNSGLPEVLEAAYATFAEMLREGALTLGDHETALNAPAPDTKSYFEFGGRAADPPVPLADLRDSLLGMVYSASLSLEDALFGGALRPLAELIDVCEGPVLRMSWYPPRGQGMLNHDHSDIALLTLLPAATAPGLEVRGTSGWHRVELAANEVIVLPGELSEALGGAAAMRHRVVACGLERMSASLFVNASPALPTLSGRSAGEILVGRLEAVRDQTSRESGR